jgi:hypothetical protein
MPHAVLSLPASLIEELTARGYHPEQVAALAGDVSARRYLRARTPRGSVVIALYPPQLRDACHRFAVTAGWLQQVGVRGPGILCAGCEQGWMVVEDLGPATLFDRYRGRTEPWAELEGFMDSALRSAERIAQLDPGAVLTFNPPLGPDLLRQELRRTWETFLAPAGLVEDAGLHRALDGALDELCARAGAGPLVPCHRDFMVRNLLPLEAPGQLRQVAVLDHQDLRLGPRFYDLASLLNDSLIPPPEVAERLLERRIATEEAWLEYHRVAAQRTLKALGTYASAGSGVHRALIPRTWRSALAHLQRVPEATGVAEELARRSPGVLLE